MFQARSSFGRSGARLIAASALVLTATLASIPFAVDVSAAQISPPRFAAPPKFAAVSGKVGAKAFNVTRPQRIKPSGVTGGSMASRVPPKPPKPPRGQSGDGPSKGPRRPPVIVRPYPVPPVIVTDPAPVIIGGGASTGGPPSAGPGPAGQSPGRPGIAALPPAGNGDYLPDEVVTQIALNGADQAAALLARRFRLTQLESFDIPGADTRLIRWRITNGTPPPAVVRAIEAERRAVSISPNFVMRLYGEPPVPAVAAPLEQYALAKMQVPQAHVLAQGGDVLIAIIDGGVDVSHPELQGVIADTFDAVQTGAQAHPHGTAIAGAIAAQARLKGTAPAARILAAQAFDRGQDRMEGNGYVVARAVYWATDRGARIINMSFAGSRDPNIEQSLRYARQKGVILVAAAGNKGPLSPPLFPAANPDVIAVTATDANDKVFQQANRGKYIAIAAPGVELFLPGLNGTYQEISGTSFAAAEVSGTIALLVEHKPDLTHNDARRILMSTARDLGPPGIDPHFGAGLVDAYRALISIVPAAVAGSSTTGSAAEQN
jgi:subtilisin family serine protease